MTNKKSTLQFRRRIILFSLQWAASDIHICYIEDKMLTENSKQAYYQALLDKNTEYEGIFYVGVKTTGVFCRPTCPS